MRELSRFEIGFAAAAALDARNQAQVNKVFEAADAALAWHAQTGAMTDQGYNAIVQANYLRSQGKVHQSPMAGPMNALLGFAVLIVGFFILLFLLVGIGRYVFGIGAGGLPICPPGEGPGHAPCRSASAPQNLTYPESSFPHHWS